jgi:hypothetical protein
LDVPSELSTATLVRTRLRKSRRIRQRQLQEAGCILGARTVFYLESRYKCLFAVDCDHSTYNPARNISVPIRERIRHIPRCAQDGMFHCPVIINGLQWIQASNRLSGFLRHLTKKDHLPPSHYCSCGDVFTRSDALRRHVNRSTDRPCTTPRPVLPRSRLPGCRGAFDAWLLVHFLKPGIQNYFVPSILFVPVSYPMISRNPYIDEFGCILHSIYMTFSHITGDSVSRMRTVVLDAVSEKSV